MEMNKLRKKAILDSLESGKLYNYYTRKFFLCMAIIRIIIKRQIMQPKRTLETGVLQTVKKKKKEEEEIT